MSVENTYRVRSRAELLAIACSALTVIIGVFVLLGWEFHIRPLMSILPGFVTMKPNTAIGLALLGLSQLFLSSDGVENPRGKRLALCCFGLAATIGLITMAEYSFDRNLGIDELLYVDPDHFGQRYPPGRLAPITALSFIFVAFAMLASFYLPKRLPRIGQGIAFLVAILSLQALVSYALGIQTTFGIASHTRMAVHTAAGLILLCSSYLALSIDQGVMRILFADTSGARSARRLIFAAILVPPLVNMIETAGRHAGWYDQDFGTLLRVMASMVFFMLMVLRNAENLHESEEARRVKENESARLRAENASELRFRGELIEARHKAERAAGTKSEFLARMSHEIRTPLNGIIGIADLLTRTPLNEQQKNFVQTLRSSGAGLLTIINDILDFSKIEAGKVDVENVDFNLHEAVLGQVELLKAGAREKGLALSLHVDPNLPTVVNGDPGRVGQILLNFIANAIKFTQKGEIEVRVDRDAQAKAGFVCAKFSVTDTGIGLSKEQIEKLFRPFAQADSSTSRKFGGTGLGLSISQSLAHLMGGEIGVESASGKGSTFWFTLKFKEVSEQATRRITSKAESPAELPTRDQAGQPLRILVAEDNMVNQLVVREHLNQLGLSVQTVANGQEALAALGLGQFHLVLMDCQMPEMDGYTATAKWRASEKMGQRLPVIALTANAMTEDKERCLAVGMDDYLPKPFTRDELVAVLGRWLRP